MDGRAIRLVVALAMGLTSVACGDERSSGTGGAGGDPAGDGDCSLICENPCVEEVLPAGTVDDCLTACRMGGFSCIPETISILECLETIDCGSLASPECISDSEAFTTCLSRQ